MRPIFFENAWVWLAAALFLLALCTYIPIRVKDDALRNRLMRWLLVPVSIVIIAYVYPVGIEVFRRLATR